MMKACFIIISVFFASSLFAIGKSEITRLNTTLQAQSHIIFDETTSSETKLASIRDAQAIISQLIQAETSGKTSEHLFVGIKVKDIKITESTQAHILQKLREMSEALDAKKDSVQEEIQEARRQAEEFRFREELTAILTQREAEHQDELDEMLSHINGIEQDHQGLAHRLLEILNRRRS